MGFKAYLVKALNSVLKRHDYVLTRYSELEELQKHLYELQMLSLYSEFIKKGDLCFDIGAHVGSRTDVFRKLGASVIAVEPQNDCVRILRSKYNTDSNVKIIEKALGAYEGEVEMQICTNTSNVSSCSREWVDKIKDRINSAHWVWDKWVWDETIRVQMTTLDKLIAEFGLPSFCKIDVEGFEYEVIKGLSQPIKALSLEANPFFLSPAVNSIRKLVDLGLTRFNYSIGESMEWALPEWVSGDEIVDRLENLSDKILYVDVYAVM